MWFIEGGFDQSLGGKSRNQPTVHGVSHNRQQYVAKEFANKGLPGCSATEAIAASSACVFHIPAINQLEDAAAMIADNIVNDPPTILLPPLFLCLYMLPFLLSLKIPKSAQRHRGNDHAG